MPMRTVEKGSRWMSCVRLSHKISNMGTSVKPIDVIDPIDDTTRMRQSLNEACCLLPFIKSLPRARPYPFLNFLTQTIVNPFSTDPPRLITPHGFDPVNEHCGTLVGLDLCKTGIIDYMGMFQCNAMLCNHPLAHEDGWTLSSSFARSKTFAIMEVVKLPRPQGCTIIDANDCNMAVKCDRHIQTGVPCLL